MNYEFRNVECTIGIGAPGLKRSEADFRGRPSYWRPKKYMTLKLTV